ncbi:hypothetical protein GN956_G16629 [Arapaima gigas]
MAKLERAAHEPQREDASSRAAAGGSAPCLVPSFAAACELLSAPYSCLVVDGSRRHVALAPLYLSKKRSGIREQLDAELLKYSESMKGVPLAYDDVRVLGQHGDIYDDQGFIHMNIEATFVIFRPRTGQKLVGVINKVGVSHVGCLVHGCFNASIPKPHPVSLEAWKGAGFNVGDSLEFEVSQLDADAAGVLLIRGRLDKARMQELMAADNCAEKDILEVPMNLETDVTDGMKSKKKKKKKNKSREVEVLQDACAPEDGLPSDVESPGFADTQQLNLNGQLNGKKKKKIKKEKLVEEPEEDCVTEVLCSAPRGKEDHKHGKKRKKGLEEEELALTADIETPKPKKKKVT